MAKLNISESSEMLCRRSGFLWKLTTALCRNLQTNAEHLGRKRRYQGNPPADCSDLELAWYEDTETLNSHIRTNISNLRNSRGSGHIDNTSFDRPLFGPDVIFHSF